jgi:formyl-CoA transferase
VAVLDEVFRGRTLDEWRSTLATMEGVWAPVQQPGEVPRDPQAVANGIMTQLGEGEEQVVASPVQFDERPLGAVRPAPGLGEHTDEILLELGLDADELLALKLADTIT